MTELAIILLAMASGAVGAGIVIFAFGLWIISKLPD